MNSLYFFLLCTNIWAAAANAAPHDSKGQMYLIALFNLIFALVTFL